MATGDIKVITGKIRLSYAHLFEPQVSFNKGTPKYGTVIIVPKSDTKTYEALREAQEQAKIRDASKFSGGKFPKNGKTALKDGDVDADLEKNPEYADSWYLSANSVAKPGLVDRNMRQITDESELYSGAYARVSLTAFCYNVDGGQGVTFGLKNVQKLGDGPKFGNVSVPSDDFAELDDDEYPEDLPPETDLI